MKLLDLAQIERDLEELPAETFIRRHGARLIDAVRHQTNRAHTLAGRLEASAKRNQRTLDILYGLKAALSIHLRVFAKNTGWDPDKKSLPTTQKRWREAMVLASRLENTRLATYIVLRDLDGKTEPATEPEAAAELAREPEQAAKLIGTLLKQATANLQKVVDERRAATAHDAEHDAAPDSTPPGEVN